MADNLSTGNLMINLFDGTRKPWSVDQAVLLRILDGNQQTQKTDEFRSANIYLEGLPVFNNFGDNYTVIASCDGHTQSGFTPVKISPHTLQSIDLMLLPSDGTFNFRDALWPTLQRTHPTLATLLANGAADASSAADRYTQLMETQPESLASFFNLTTAMSAINLPQGTPLDYIKEVIWDNTFARDRFFGWADPKLIDQVKLATLQGGFAPEIDPAIFHPGATSSWKQIQFGEANVQLTFHEGQTKQIDGVNCIMIEPDIDYYKDLAAHFFLEVVVNAITHTITDPKQVYLLRWIAGQHAGVPNFNPPYVIL